MKKLHSNLKRIAHDLDALKHDRRALLWILAVDLALAISSNVVDYPWLIRVPRNLVIFAPICSLYPALLVIWFLIYFFRKKVPAFFTAFLFVGLFSYGIMSWIYYPLYMSWTGINFHDVASMFWVAAYALQALIISSEIRKIPWWQFAFIMGYFFFKDYSDRFLGTFLDILLDTYPEYLKTIFFVSALVLHTIAAIILLRLFNARKSLL